MKTTLKERREVLDRLAQLGIEFDDACKLRRIAMTLHRWHELECGDDHGCIERDDATNKPFWLNSTTMRRSRIADRESGALMRLVKIMDGYPHLTHYVQTDPRGASLYVLRKDDVDGSELDQVYSRGVAIY